MTAPLERIARSFAGREVVVLGDVMLDRTVVGVVRRVSPEAPVPVLEAASGSATLGGAGNVARNVAHLGGRATLLGVLGADPAADEVRRLAEREAGLSALLLSDPTRRTTQKTRFVANGQHLLRVDAEDVYPLAGALAAALLDRLRAVLPRSGALVLSDYAKGVLTSPGAPTSATVGAAIALAREAGVPVIADPKSSAVALFAGADVLAPNAIEAERATGIDAIGDEGARVAARALSAMAGGATIVMTRGARGSTVLAPPGDVAHLPTRAREVFDVSGAGDTLVAVLALSQGQPILDAARLANVAAGLAVGRVGTAAVALDELLAALDEDAADAGRPKIVGAARAAAIAGEWCRRAERVVMTNGCFDLLHPGHLHLLREARRAGDRLVVAVNSDASVRRLKGRDRPVQDERTRARVLAALEATDLVVLFDGDTPAPEIEAIRPDVLAKGAEYRVEEIAGAASVTAAGGRILLVPRLEGFSTTGLVDALRPGRAG